MAGKGGNGGATGVFEVDVDVGGAHLEAEKCVRVDNGVRRLGVRGGRDSGDGGVGRADNREFRDAGVEAWSRIRDLAFGVFC